MERELTWAVDLVTRNKLLTHFLMIQLDFGLLP
jgi:hypothetical protein